MFRRDKIRVIMGSGYDATYQQIKAAAVQLFARQGYVATGIRSIAREAGFSTTALYHHVSNKEELLVDIMAQGFEMQIGNARSALAGERSPEGKLSALVGRHVRFEASEQALANVITIEYPFLGEEARQQLVPLRNSYERIWEDVLVEGAESGAFEIDDPRLTCLTLLEMCSAPEAWYRPDGRLSVEEIGDAFVDMALNLVRARRRRRSRAPKAPAAVATTS